MIKVKTFTSPLKVFHVKEELEQLDQTVNQFIEKNNVTAVVSVNDTTTTDDTGASIGIIRVLTYA
jgi:capsule polysaccharide modification protein KpsS